MSARSPRLRRRQPDRTFVSLTFDDGLVSHYTLLPLFRRHGVHCTFFVSSRKVGTGDPYLSWPQLEALAGDGHEVGGHTADHVKLTTVDAAEARRQILDDRRLLFERGFAVTNFAYPHGAVNSALRGLVADCGYNSARRAWGLAVAGTMRARTETVPPQDHYATRAIPSIDANAAAPDLWKLTTAAERVGGWVQLVFHEVEDAAMLDAFLGWLASRAGHGTQVRTVADVIGGSCRRPPT